MALFRVTAMSMLVLGLLASAGCGGATTDSVAASETKKAMEEHGTKYESITCEEPTSGHFVCEAVGSNADAARDAWCSVVFDDGGALADFDASQDCHWPSVAYGHKPKNQIPIQH